MKPAITTIKQSAILAHLAKFHQLYPLPSGDWDIEADLPECVPFDAEQFCSVQKSSFALEWGVQPGQVNRWCRSGMPQLADGRIGLWEANEWLRDRRGEWLEKHFAREGEKVRALLQSQAEPEDNQEP